MIKTRTQPISIREPIETDWPELCRMGEAFFREGNLPSKFFAEVFEANWRAWIENEVGVMLVAVDPDNRPMGAMGAVIARAQCNYDTEAQEMFWYIDPAHRNTTAAMRIWTTMEKVLKEAQVSRLAMVHLESINQRLSEIYKRRGYSLIEHLYVKEL